MSTALLELAVWDPPMILLLKWQLGPKLVLLENASSGLSKNAFNLQGIYSHLQIEFVKASPLKSLWISCGETPSTKPAELSSILTTCKQVKRRLHMR